MILSLFLLQIHLGIKSNINLINTLGIPKGKNISYNSVK